MTRPIAITGMHRAGTSMVARAVKELGLWLGHPDDLVPAAPDNPDGFFEHAGLIAASDALFQQLGAGWDCPPVLAAADLGRAGLDAARDLARPVLTELADHAPWAWKDPRVAPVLPFWLDLVPDVGVVLCLRNPLEVAASLRARNGMSLALGLRLWYLHMDAAVAATDGHLVTHYDAWFHRPEAEVARLAEHAGIDPSPAQLAAAASVPARHRRHARFDAPALRTARVHAELRELYERLTAEAGWSDGATAITVALNGSAQAPPAAPEVDERPVGQVQPWVVDVGVARYEVHKRNGRVAQLEQRIAAAAPSESTGPVGSVEDLQAGIYDLQLAVAELTARVANGIDAETRARDVAYARMIRGVRAEVRRLVPPGEELLVISEGEPALVDLHGRPARHFPVGPSPLAPGPHPATGVEAAAHLVVRQALGATHLVVPSTAGWWLGAYPELADRLTRAATVVSRGDDGTTILRLHAPTEPSRFANLAAALDAAGRRLGDDPSVLDATASGLDEPRAFRPPDSAAALPYLDATVHLVVIDAAAGDARRIDAHRVASHGVLTGGADGWVWSWTAPAPRLAADVLLLAAPLERPAAYLDVLVSTLPAGLEGEVLVVAPPAEEDTWRRAADGRLAVLTGRPGAIVGELVGRSSADHVVLVDGSAIPLEGWLPALLAPFARSARVGLVAGRLRLLAGDGWAGMVVAAHAVDGDRMEPALGVEGDHLTRPIDVAVPGLAAWRRDLLAERGLDDRYATLEFALADHCWALAATGHESLVQPEAETADLGVGGPSPDALTADRARLNDAWAAVP